ncbi:MULTISPECIES: shikimate dehydrogenase [Thermocrispum]|uniref:Shikimate dehydrogenase n=1 Tax=Thermocrispum agreste TaxID=37925 RepID=A0ABD6FGT0_9PSEU|nr:MULTISPECIES: shikimate dehydrogenase [Thermocrispum]
MSGNGDRRSPGARRAAVLGKPVAHSLSPVLHLAAYRALGLTDWTYERVEADAQRLPELLSGFGSEWVGVSVTMPGKHAALEFATEATPRARAVGAANTLVKLGDGGWRADCTDVDGVAGAVLAVCGKPRTDRPAVVIGGGGTASAAAVACHQLRLSEVLFVVREPARAAGAMAAAQRAGLSAEARRWADADWAELAATASVVINTAPADAVRPHAAELATAASVLDVIYHPWPTPLAEAVLAGGGRLATGLDMLLHQAFGQVEQFTGKPAPRAEMRAALREATGGVHELPLG